MTTRHTHLALSLIALAGLAGCEVDSFIDPSVLGRWEKTPTVVPILDRVSVIEDMTGEEPEYADPSESDLVPVAKQYRFGPGDRVQVTLYDVIEPGRPEPYERAIDTRGAIELPQFGQVIIGGMTADEARAAIAAVVSKLVPDPLVSITPSAQRNQTFTIIGAVQQPGPYYIPSADYRILEALTSGGAFDNSVAYVYVIRQVQLTDEEKGILPPGTNIDPKKFEARETPRPAAPSGQQLLDTINELSKPKGESPAPAPEPAPAGPPDASPKPSPAMFAQQPPSAQPRANPGNDPPVDMVDPDAPPRAAQAPSIAPQPGAQWVFLNGRWIQVARVETEPGSEGGPTQLVSQRIIRIPLQELLNGKRRYNIVIRPGDIIRVPSAPRGVFYVSGQVARPGIFNFPDQGRMTLIRAVHSAGGLGALAIPERVDLMRMVGGDRQATIRLNLRAIAEQTQPDIYIKADDVLNIGTSFWAQPLAVIRNGFRASYGFGFVLDRNFDEALFGVRRSGASGL